MMCVQCGLKGEGRTQLHMLYRDSAYDLRCQKRVRLSLCKLDKNWSCIRMLSGCRAILKTPKTR
eukprot:1158675-Amphidinium_carterae.1